MFPNWSESKMTSTENSSPGLVCTKVFIHRCHFLFFLSGYCFDFGVLEILSFHNLTVYTLTAKLGGEIGFSGKAY